MRHRVAHRKLGRTTEHRLSLLRNLAAGLVLHERIRTTLAKAKELRPFAERLITLGKRDSLHARRRALRILPRKEAVAKLFSEVCPRFADRGGGYTRILRLGPRPGDGTPMAFIELVDFKFTAAKEGGKASKEAKKTKESPGTKKAAGEDKPATKPKDEPEASAEAAEPPRPTKKTGKKIAEKPAKKAATTKPSAKKPAAKTATTKTSKGKSVKKTSKAEK